MICNWKLSQLVILTPWLLRVWLTKIPIHKCKFVKQEQAQYKGTSTEREQRKSNGYYSKASLYRTWIYWIIAYIEQSKHPLQNPMRKCSAVVVMCQTPDHRNIWCIPNTAPQVLLQVCSSWGGRWWWWLFTGASMLGEKVSPRCFDGLEYLLTLA